MDKCPPGRATRLWPSGLHAPGAAGTCGLDSPERGPRHKQGRPRGSARVLGVLPCHPARSAQPAGARWPLCTQARTLGPGPQLARARHTPCLAAQRPPRAVGASDAGPRLLRFRSPGPGSGRPRPAKAAGGGAGGPEPPPEEQGGPASNPGAHLAQVPSPENAVTCSGPLCL